MLAEPPERGSTTMEAIIFIGVQGSGKTTFYRERFFDTHVRVSLDLLKTRPREREFVETCLKTGQRFVIDNTNPRAADRVPYIALARAAGFRVIGYFFHTELREALKRNSQRSGKAAIPAAGVVSTFKRLQRPIYDEGFDQLFSVFGSEGQFQVEEIPRHAA
jgi:predicted kinase